MSTIRVPCVLASAQGMAAQILGTIPQATRLNPPGQLPRLIPTREGINLELITFRFATNQNLGEASAAVSGLWTMWWLMPVDDVELKTGKRAFRFLRRRVLDASNTAPGGGLYLYGPWTMPRILADAPGLYSNLFPDGRPPLTILGDTSDAVAAVSYDPTDQECLDDVDD